MSGTVQTIEKTSKDLKLKIAIGYALGCLGIPVVFAGITNQSSFILNVGMLSMISGLIMIAYIKLKIWWNHA